MHPACQSNVGSLHHHPKSYYPRYPKALLELTAPFETTSLVTFIIFSSQLGHLLPYQTSPTIYHSPVVASSLLSQVRTPTYLYTPKQSNCSKYLSDDQQNFFSIRPRVAPATFFHPFFNQIKMIKTRFARQVSSLQVQPAQYIHPDLLLHLQIQQQPPATGSLKLIRWQLRQLLTIESQ